MCLKGHLYLTYKIPHSVAAVTKADCLRVGLAFRNDFFNATVKHLALLLHSPETKSDCCQRNGREDSGRDLNETIGKDFVFLANEVLLRADSYFSWVLLGQRTGITSWTLWTGNGPWRHIAPGITAQQFKP